ncbi:MAG: sigma 54-interacting transcriptional regulator [Phycisphaeraceae bacterium]|nr:sigma 54-interacting transcriptional regulator [Phycisphaerales bacterium]QOJ18429.1 MAG: sigma 54-interacting transcriptional regulator [Phycisphaeraceae bacterium]
MTNTPEPGGRLNRKALVALLEATRAITLERAVDPVLEQITRQAASILEAEAASILLLTGEGRELEFRTAVGPASGRLRRFRMPADAGIAGQVLRTGRAVRLDEARENRHFFAAVDEATDMRTRGMVAAPLIDQGEPQGVLEVLNPKGRACFGEEDVELLQLFANIAAGALRTVRVLDAATRENRALRAARGGVEVVGQSPALAEAMRLCQRVAGATTTVLLLGETGTGKEVAARAIHAASRRADKPFVAANCAAFSDHLLESELFGHEKGAFTGADRDRAGLFELAEGGTLFLDEVGETSPATQAKLLRVLQEREFTRLGGSTTIPCDVRVLAATNRDLHADVAAGRFREDLLYRLHVFPIRMPPLRERRQDIPRLVDHFTHRIAADMGVSAPSVASGVLDAMMTYHWPGNIRELRNVIERCVLLADPDVRVEHLPPEVTRGGAATDPVGTTTRTIAAASQPAPRAADQTYAAQERAIIAAALDAADWNQSEAARRLDVTRDFLRHRIRLYALTRPE